ncbi:MAG: hypothetical protein SAMD01599839_09340 [Rectinema sp.]
MPLLSFREFIALETGEEPPVFAPFGPIPVQGTSRLLALFREYRKTGTRPFYSEGNFAERLLSVLEKSLYSDVPFFLPNITKGNIRLMNAITGTLAKSPIPRLHVRSLCADWNIGAEKLYQILFVMESAGVLRIIRKEHDYKARTVGHKLFLGDPALYEALGGDTGTAREALVTAMLQEGGYSVYASSDETICDFVVRGGTIPGEGRISIEVGGSGKSRKKADFVVRDDLDYASGSAIPLWSLGFLY